MKVCTKRSTSGSPGSQQVGPHDKALSTAVDIETLEDCAVIAGAEFFRI